MLKGGDVDSLEKELDKAIMDTIWISLIDENVKQRVHPYWFNANGQTFTFGIDVERIKRVFAAEVGWRNDPTRHVGDFTDERGKTHNLMTGQEWYDRFFKQFMADHTDENIGVREITLVSVNASAKKAAGIE